MWLCACEPLCVCIGLGIVMKWNCIDKAPCFADHRMYVYVPCMCVCESCICVIESIFRYFRVSSTLFLPPSCFLMLMSLHFWRSILRFNEFPFSFFRKSFLRTYSLALSPLLSLNTPMTLLLSSLPPSLCSSYTWTIAMQMNLKMRMD